MQKALVGSLGLGSLYYSSDKFWNKMQIWISGNLQKEDFTEKSKNLGISLKIILLSYQKNYIGISSTMSKNAAKSFDILATSLNVLHNYFDKRKTDLFQYMQTKIYLLGI